MITESSAHQALAAYMAADQRILLVGPPGCGKTARIKAIAEAQGRRLVVMRCGLLERVDIGGCLVPDIEACITKALPLEQLLDLRTTTVPTLLFLDDLGQAPVDVQSPLMKLFDTGEPDSLSPCVLIWGATNRPGDVAGVPRLSEPLRSRFNLAFEMAGPPKRDEHGNEIPKLHLDGVEELGTWHDEVVGWCEWAVELGAAGEIIAWHRATDGRTLYDWKPNTNPAVRMPDYRTWETVINLWNKGLRDLSSISAAIGRTHAVEFMAFARLADDIPTPDEVWADPLHAIVPQKDEANALFLVSSMLARNAEPRHAGALLQYVDRMPRVYGALLIRDAVKRLNNSLTGTKEFKRWFVSNEELFAVGW